MGNINELTLNDLQMAVQEDTAAYRCRTKLRPIGDDGDKVFPPTYAGGIYAVEKRRIDVGVVQCVLLDSVQSQANRMEEVIQEAFLPGWRELPTNGSGSYCDLPIVAVYIENHGWVTSLTAPHRIHDAILRDSNLDGIRFRDSDIGKRIVKSRLHDATGFYQYCPTALLFGTWDSTGGEGLDAAKIPRAVVSEIIGVDITPGVRTGSRIDPIGIRAQSATIYKRTDGGWALQDSNGAWIGAQLGDLENDEGNPRRFGKGKPSDINHGNVTPDLNRFGDRREIRKQHLDRLPDLLRDAPIELRYEIRSRDGELRSNSEVRGGAVPIEGHAIKPGGVTMAYGLQTWTLSLTQLRRLRFPVNGQHDETRNRAARTVLAALAIYALALRNRCGYWLRSRCELFPESPVALEQIKVDGTSIMLALPSVEAAKKLLDDSLKAAATAKNAIEWHKTVIRLTPSDQLKKLVELSDRLIPDSGEASEDEELTSDASDQD